MAVAGGVRGVGAGLLAWLGTGGNNGGPAAAPLAWAAVAYTRREIGQTSSAAKVAAATSSGEPAVPGAVQPAIASAAVVSPSASAVGGWQPGQFLQQFMSLLVSDGTEAHPNAGLLLGNGSDELISLMSVACARPGAAVLAPAPSFVMYDVSTRLAGMDYVPVSLKPDFSLDTQAMLQAIAQHRPALVWIAYPNNPTGNAFDRAAIEQILAAAPGLVVLDEAYQPFADDSWMGQLPHHDKLVVMRTVSKLGLAGIRLGYMAAAPRWIEQFDKVRPPYNVSVLNVECALFALEHAPVFAAQAQLICSERERLLAALATFPGLQPFPSQANMILLRVRGQPGAAARLYDALKKRQILVKNVSTMHPLLANCLRLTVGTAPENTLLLAALEASL